MRSAPHELADGCAPRPPPERSHQGKYSLRLENRFDPLLAHILNHVVPIRCPFRNTLMHPQTIYLEHGGCSCGFSKKNALRLFYCLQLSIRPQAQPVANSLRHDDPTSFIDFEFHTHTIPNTTYHFKWQPLGPAPLPRMHVGFLPFQSLFHAPVFSAESASPKLTSNSNFFPGRPPPRSLFRNQDRNQSQPDKVFERRNHSTLAPLLKHRLPLLRAKSPCLQLFHVKHSCVFDAKNWRVQPRFAGGLELLLPAPFIGGKNPPPGSSFSACSTTDSYVAFAVLGA